MVRSNDPDEAQAGVDLTALEESGTVDTVLGATAFDTSLVQATGWYDGGELTIERLLASRRSGRVAASPAA